ncbi:MAG TPA: inositol monophosphatase family protein [Dissulfurispiraceae bacterium]|nr:inositol monophosphatase family protein [Dissulfurispiraceae bacterium]
MENAVAKNGPEFLHIAREAALSASGIILEHLGKLRQADIAQKQLADFVTTVDRESEQVIVGILRRHFPEHRILAEETVHEQDEGGFLWIIDPLDGTTNYIHGLPVFAVSIALQYQGTVIAGVVLDPVRQECFTALRGQGAHINGKALHISSAMTAERALIATGFPFKRRELVDRYLAAFRRVFVRVSDLRRAGAAALDLAYVAGGRCDGFFELGLNAWDAAAGSLLIEEAGGVITDFGGGNRYLATGNIVAGNPFIHGLLLDEVQAVFQDILPA